MCGDLYCGCFHCLSSTGTLDFNNVLLAILCLPIAYIFIIYFAVLISLYCTIYGPGLVRVNLNILLRYLKQSE
jgi:hypothetical protein